MSNDYPQWGPGHAAPQPPKKKLNLWVQIGVGVVGAFTFFAVVGACSSGSDTADKTPKASPSTSQASDTPIPSHAGDLLTWYTGVEPSFTKFENDLDTVSNSGTLPSVSVCTGLRDDVKDIQKHPIPASNALVHNAWNRAMNYYLSSFESCRDGDYTSMIDSMDKGTEQVGEATAALPAS